MARRQVENQPVYAFPLRGPLPSELAAPEGYGPIRRWWWNWSTERELRRRNGEDMTSPVAMILSVFLGRAMNEGSSGLRILFKRRDPGELAQAAHAVEQRCIAAVEQGLFSESAMAAMLGPLRDRGVDPRTSEVQFALPGGWVKVCPLERYIAAAMVERLMDLSPNGIFILTRADEPPLLVELFNVVGEADGLEVRWTVEE